MPKGLREGRVHERGARSGIRVKDGEARPIGKGKQPPVDEAFTTLIGVVVRGAAGTEPTDADLLRLGEAGVVISAQVVGDIHRIADAQERIATSLELIGQFVANGGKG